VKKKRKDPPTAKRTRLTVAKARAMTAPLVAKKKVSPRTAKASPKDVGVARTQLQRRYEAEIDDRIRHYEKTYSLLASRGPAGIRAFGVGVPPLRVVAEGDSWFDYPLHARGGIVPRLETAIGVPILSLAKAGDETRYMLGVHERKRLEKVLRDAAAAGRPFDALLFSGGGNDIVGNPMCLWVKAWTRGVPPEDHLDVARFDEILGVVEAAYDDLLIIRDRLDPKTRVFLHGYDFAPPNGKGVCFMGPWLKPALDYRGFPGMKERTALVKAMLLRFERLLEQIAMRENVTLVPTQGTLGPKDWSNELHPTSAGFDKITAKFHDAMKAVFGARIA
jgi:hypothetical protein